MTKDASPKAVQSRPVKSAKLLRHEDSVHHAFPRTADAKPFYRLGGVAAGFKLVGGASAKEIYNYYNNPSLAIDGKRILFEHTNWTGEWSFKWSQNLSYQLFLKVLEGKPVSFSKAVQCLLAFDAAALHLKGGDVYTKMDIIPCGYNIDGYNTNVLDELIKVGKDAGQDYVDEALKAATGQYDAGLLTDLASGYAVSKETADAVCAHAAAFATQVNRPDLKPGTVRPYPGKGGLGKKRASYREVVDTDSPHP